MTMIKVFTFLRKNNLNKFEVHATGAPQLFKPIFLSPKEKKSKRLNHPL